jgi:hypothetical protein
MLRSGVMIKRQYSSGAHNARDGCRDHQKSDFRASIRVDSFHADGK